MNLKKYHLAVVKKGVEFFQTYMDASRIKGVFSVASNHGMVDFFCFFVTFFIVSNNLIFFRSQIFMAKLVVF